MVNKKYLLFAGCLISACGLWCKGNVAGAETFTFNEDSPVDGGFAGVTMTNGAITLTSVAVSAPQYTLNTETSTFEWDGETFTNGHRTNVASPGTMGINNQSITTGTANTSESQHVDPGESWTFQFNVPVIFKVLDMSSMGAADLVRATIDTTPTPTIFNFGEADFDSSDNRNDPFGTSFVIPAATNITLFNSTSIVTSWPTTQGSGNAWRIGAFVVEQPTLSGDFDLDGDVDGADFVAWQTHFPLTSGAEPAMGDADGDADVDGADFAAWQDTFPAITTPGITYVPEPVSLAMASIGVFACGLNIRFRQAIKRL